MSFGHAKCLTKDNPYILWEDRHLAWLGSSPHSQITVSHTKQPLKQLQTKTWSQCSVILQCTLITIIIYIPLCDSACTFVV